MMELYYNLHLHSCLSPCGHDDMLPADAVNMCALCGYDVVALTDHNSAANCPAAAEAARRAGLVFLPGLELTTREEVHVLCLFAALDDALAFSAYVYERLPDIVNRPEVFGRQLVVNTAGEITGEVTKVLGGVTADIGIYELPALAESHNGLAIPAHIDRPSYSLLSNLGLYDEAMGFTLAELSPYAPAGFQSPLPVICGSDAHDLASIPDARHTLSASARTPEAVLAALRQL